MSYLEMTNEEEARYGTWGDERSPSPTSSLPPPYDYEEVPPGWIKALDPQSNQYFYIDSLANPPVSIWVHPFRHPQFLNFVGITPDEVPDDLDLIPPAGTPPPAFSPSTSPTSEYHEQSSFLKGIKEKIRASKEARAAAHANIVRKRFRMKQLFYIKARKAILASRIARGDWHYGEIELTPPDRHEYGGPEYREGNLATVFVRKTFGAFCRGNCPNSLPS